MLSAELVKHDQNCPFGTKLVNKIAAVIARLAGLKPNVRRALEVNVIGDKMMRALNFRYRRLNKVTDVLSFAWSEDKKIKSALAGQIFICYPQIRRQAKERGISARAEFIRLLAHGILHLFGYDHADKKSEKIMFAKQERVVKMFSGQRGRR